MTSVTQRLERLLSTDPDAEVAVIALIDWLESGGDDDPFAPVDPHVWAAVKQLNRDSEAEYRAWVEATTWTTAEVVDFLATVNDRKGVDRRRKRGQLIGFPWGNTTRHPIWQFDPETRDVVEGLDRVLPLLADGNPPESIHSIGLHLSYDAGDMSIADLLAAGDVDTAVIVAGLASNPA